MDKDLNQRLVDSAKGMIDYQDKIIDIFQKADDDGTSRITWLVAISGFAIINIPIINNYKIPSLPIAAIIIPWIITATLGVVGHWRYKSRRITEIIHYTTKRELFMAYITNGPNSATLGDLNDILASKKEPLPKLLKDQKIATLYTDAIEIIIMMTFVTSIAITMQAYL